MTKLVRDARPPTALIKMLNPIMRIVLRSRLGHLVKPFGLLEFSGRRSGRLYRVPTGIYRARDTVVVFTPAAWGVNFCGGAPVTVHHRGRAMDMTGTLIPDPSEVAQALRSVLAGGISSRLLGFDMPPNHELNASDVATLRRTMIQFHISTPSHKHLI